MNVFTLCKNVVGHTIVLLPLLLSPWASTCQERACMRKSGYLTTICRIRDRIPQGIAPPDKIPQDKSHKIPQYEKCRKLKKLNIAYNYQRNVIEYNNSTIVCQGYIVSICVFCLYYVYNIVNCLLLYSCE